MCHFVLNLSCTLYKLKCSVEIVTILNTCVTLNFTYCTLYKLKCKVEIATKLNTCVTLYTLQIKV